MVLEFLELVRHFRDCCHLNGLTFRLKEPPSSMYCALFKHKSLNRFTTKITYKGRRQQNLLATLLKRALIMSKVFNIKWISLLTSRRILTFFTAVKQLKVNFNFWLKKRTPRPLHHCLLEFLFSTRTVPFLLSDQRSF